MKSFIIVLFSIFSITAVAQPPARTKVNAQESAKVTTATTKGVTALRDFPVQQSMPQNTIWRRDLYRTLDLKLEGNAPLYYPTQPHDKYVSLFTYLFKLILRGKINAYNYNLDGKEDFSKNMIMKPMTMMERYHIHFEKKDDRVKIDDSDIPSADVLKYYVKESTYFDQNTASFHKQIVALCPVLVRSDEFGSVPVNYPMFWINYKEASPYLAKLQLMTSSVNNAASMSAEDYFTLNRYEGKIYMTNNLQDENLANYCKTDTAMKNEQEKIEEEVKTVENYIFGNIEVPVNSDSTLVIEATVEKVKKTSSRRKLSSVKKEKAPKKKKSSTSTSFSVRKQRH